MYMRVCLDACTYACMHVYHTSAWKSEKGSIFLRAVVSGVCESPYGCRELNSDPLQVQKVLLATEITGLGKILLQGAGLKRKGTEGGKEEKPVETGTAEGPVLGNQVLILPKILGTKGVCL